MQNRIVFITGGKGSGKTTLADKIAKHLYYTKQRVIVVAPMGGFDLPGVPIVRNVQQLGSPEIKDRSFIVLPESDRLAEMAFLYAWTAGNCWLFVDEIDLYMNHMNADENLRKIIRYGRHRGVNLVAIAQRPANVHRDLTAQSDYIVIFSTVENRDVEYLAKRIGQENAEKIRRLPLYKPLVYTRGTISEPENDSPESPEPPE
jgi:SpoVK/Ycf46/Vps4 family AAA+-type ATPase